MAETLDNGLRVRHECGACLMITDVSNPGGHEMFSEVDSCMWGEPRAHRNPKLNQLAPFKMPSPLSTSSSSNSMQSSEMQCTALVRTHTEFP